MEEHYALFQDMSKNLDVLLRRKDLYSNDNLFFNFIRDFKKLIYDNIHSLLDPNREEGNNEKYIRLYVKYVIKKLLPICDIKIKEFTKNNSPILSDWIELEDDLYALAAFRSLKHFAYYIERGVPKKIWRDTMCVFEPLFYYASKMILSGDVDLIRASYFPGAGKTYAGNLICAFWIGMMPISILRITYSDDMAKKFTKQIANIIEGSKFKKVFPKFNLEPKRLYKTKNTGELWFSFYNESSFQATTRDGQSTGKRASVIMIDDITKGAKEAYKVEVHKAIVDMYDSDWSSRADDDSQKMILLGTMWSPYDLLNEVQKRAEKYYVLKRDNKYKYTIKDDEDKNIFISVPILDYDTDESTCPLRYSTAAMRKKRNDYQDKSLFNAVYQQKPDAPNELVLDHKNLSHYTDKTIPKAILEGDYECRGMIDPTRRGFDYFSFNIYKRCWIDDNGDKKMSKWYLVDCIYRRVTSKQALPDIVAKIIHNKMTKLTVEINTGNELPQLIEEHLAKNNYKDIEIKGIFSWQKKEDKIAEALEGMKTEIIYPDQYMYNESSELGKMMIDFTTYDIEGNNKHDDCVDCNAMFVQQECESEIGNTMQVLDSSFRL